MIIIVMGVCGSGKTTVGSQLAEKIGCSFADADEFHSDENKAKMARQQPLTDEDRFPWLSSIHEYMLSKHKDRRSAVVTCSALKRTYRTILISGNHVDIATNISHNVVDKNVSQTLEILNNNKTVCAGTPQASILQGNEEKAGNQRNATNQEMVEDVNNSKGGHPNNDQCLTYNDEMIPIFVHLTGSVDVLDDRLSKRNGHFMPKSLLQSQLDTLEPLDSNERGFAVDFDKTTDNIVSEILTRLAE